MSGLGEQHGDQESNSSTLRTLKQGSWVGDGMKGKGGVGRWFGFQHCRWWCRKQRAWTSRLRKKRRLGRGQGEDAKVGRSNKRRRRQRKKKGKRKRQQGPGEEMKDDVKDSWMKNLLGRQVRTVGLLYRYGRRDVRFEESQYCKRMAEKRKMKEKGKAEKGGSDSESHRLPASTSRELVALCLGRIRGRSPGSTLTGSRS